MNVCIKIFLIAAGTLSSFPNDIASQGNILNRFVIYMIHSQHEFLLMSNCHSCNAKILLLFKEHSTLVLVSMVEYVLTHQMVSFANVLTDTKENTAPPVRIKVLLWVVLHNYLDF